MLLPSISGWWTEPDMGNQQSSCLGGSKPATRFYKFYQINKLLGGGGGGGGKLSTTSNCRSAV